MTLPGWASRSGPRGCERRRLRRCHRRRPDYDNGQLYEGAAFSITARQPACQRLPVGWQRATRPTPGSASRSARRGRNGDGYADVIIGARTDYSNGQDREGAVLIHHGSATGLLAAASWTAESDQAEANLGISTGTAGDVNGDGFDDVIAGAPYYDGGLADEGVAFVYHQVSNRHSIAISTAGDVNGDGYDDVIVGAPYYDDGQSDEGGAFVFYGSGRPRDLSRLDCHGQPIIRTVRLVGRRLGRRKRRRLRRCHHRRAGYGNGQANEGAAFIYHGSRQAFRLWPAGSRRATRPAPASATRSAPRGRERRRLRRCHRRRARLRQRRGRRRCGLHLPRLGDRPLDLGRLDRRGRPIQRQLRLLCQRGRRRERRRLRRRHRRRTPLRQRPDGRGSRTSSTSGRRQASAWPAGSRRAIRPAPASATRSAPRAT